MGNLDCPSRPSFHSGLTLELLHLGIGFLNRGDHISRIAIVTQALSGLA